jgi:hypothetical protein
MKSAIALAILSTAVSAQSSCSASCKGTTSDGTQFDLSALMGQDYQTVGSDQNGNFFNLFLDPNTACQLTRTNISSFYLFLIMN